MEELKNDMENRDIKSRFIGSKKGQFLVCSVLIICILLFYYFAQRSIKEQVDLRHIKDLSFEYAFQVDNLLIDKELELTGCLIQVGSDKQTGNWDIYLHNLSNNQIVYPKKQKVLNKNSDDFESMEECDCLEQEFTAYFRVGNEEALTYDYEVLILNHKDKRLFKTGKYIVKGALTESNPSISQLVQNKSRLLDKFFESCSVVEYNQQMEIFTLKDDSKLYWILEKTELSTEECPIMVHFYTIREKSKLEEIVNCDFYFRDREVMEIDGYRVAMIDIPTEYQIYGVRVGQYDEENIYWEKRIYWNIR